MGRTVYTEPQRLYKGALHLYLIVILTSGITKLFYSVVLYRIFLIVVEKKNKLHLFDKDRLIQLFRKTRLFMSRVTGSPSIHFEGLYRNL